MCKRLHGCVWAGNSGQRSGGGYFGGGVRLVGRKADSLMFIVGLERAVNEPRNDGVWCLLVAGD